MWNCWCFAEIPLFNFDYITFWSSSFCFVEFDAIVEKQFLIHGIIFTYFRVFGLPADFKEGVVFSTYATLVSSVQKGIFIIVLWEVDL